MSSLGMYGNSPFLYPVYGLSGIAEAYIRLCSLHGGTVKIDCKVGPIQIEKNKATGIEIDGKFITASKIISDPSYA
jgi:Rab GDP dissociation inhibitor